MTWTRKAKVNTNVIDQFLFHWNHDHHAKTEYGFNHITPHSHTDSHLSALFLSVLTDNKMSQRQAEPITESATAKQRPVRNLCAYDLHSASSSSRSCNSLRNIAGRDPEQDAKRVDSRMQITQSSNADRTVLMSSERLVASKHVQEAQYSNDVRFMLSGTEQSVAPKHGESQDPTLIHNLHDEVNERLKTSKTSEGRSATFRVQGLFFHEFCVILKKTTVFCLALLFFFFLKISIFFYSGRPKERHGRSRHRQIFRPWRSQQKFLRTLGGNLTCLRFTCSQSSKLLGAMWIGESGHQCTSAKDGDDLKRTVQIMEVLKIQTVFETVQAQVSNLKLRNQEHHGLHEKVDWTGGHWRKYSLPDERMAAQFTSKVYVFSDSVLRLGGNCQEHLEAATIFGEKEGITCFVKCPECRPYYGSAGEPAEFEWKIHVETIEILEYIKKMLEEEGAQPSQFQGRFIFMSMYNDILWWNPQHQSVCCDNANRVAKFAENFKPGRVVTFWSWGWRQCESLTDKPHGQ